MQHLLQLAFSRFVRHGDLQVETASGHRFSLGDGGSPRVAMRLADAAAEGWLLLDPELKLGELFTDGRIVLEEGTIYDLLQLVLQDWSADISWDPPGTRWGRALRHRIALSNDPKRARRNVAHHYDLDARLYNLFLDADWQYSCAYFERPDQTLEEAQLAKKRHLAAKLLVEPGHRVLDIGSGWGGFALYLAEYANADIVKGITLSQEQLARARQRASERGLDHAVSFELEDYRATEGRFDRIVSVGMFEHVGPKSYDAYFQSAARLLTQKGVMLLHTIGRTGPPAYTNRWITKYIFPGGYIPTLSEIMPSVERSGLAVTDVEVLRLHYASTLRNWRERFLANREEAARLYEKRFCRMWECYLAMSEASFRFEDLVVFQLQLAHRNDVVPLTRDYIAAREAKLRAAESGRVTLAAAQ